MAKKAPVVRELSASEKALLSRKVNKCADEQVQADLHAGLAAGLKKEIRSTMEAGGLTAHETETAFAHIDEVETRKADEDALLRIQKMVDPADFETICPRRLDMKALDEVVGHHRYPDLESVVNVVKSTRFTVGQLSG